jgi:tetratricopeptide (TPR) repeat protein
MHWEDHLLIISHDVPEAGESNRRGIIFWREPSGEWHASNGDPGKVAISNLLGKYEKALEEFDQMEAKAQRSDEYLVLLEGLGPFVRASRNWLNVLQDARTAYPDALELIDLRDRAYEISRTAELLNQDARNSMDVAVVRRAEEQSLASAQMAVSAHRLNALAAIFFPLATLGTIFGTSLTEGWTWSRTPVPFLLFLAAGGFFGVVLSAFVHRKAQSAAQR